MRLSGFGCAASVCDAEAMRGFRGHVDYVSPEMACSAGAPWRHRPKFATWAAVEAQSHSFATYVWSLGVLTHELLTDRLPFGHVESSEEMQWAERTVAGVQVPLSLPTWVRSFTPRVQLNIVTRSVMRRV